MNCAYHSEVEAAAFCRTCGKALCENCKRDVRGIIYCEGCIAARLSDTLPAAAPVAPVVVSSGPNPALAGVLSGFFPFGVGQVYTGQYSKGLAYMVIFIALVWGASIGDGMFGPVFGIAIAAFYVFQIIDAVRTAKALQMGQPAPDPFGLGALFGGRAATNHGVVSPSYSPAAPGAVATEAPPGPPIGAILLVAIGVLFLLGNVGVLHRQWTGTFWPVILIVLGLWLGIHRWTSSPCSCYRCRSRGMVGPTVLFVLGVLFLLGEWHVAHFHRTWPVLLIALGLAVFLRRSASTAGHIETLQKGAPPQQPQGAEETGGPAAGNH